MFAEAIDVYKILCYNIGNRRGHAAYMGVYGRELQSRDYKMVNSFTDFVIFPALICLIFVPHVRLSFRLRNGFVCFSTCFFERYGV